MRSSPLLLITLIIVGGLFIFTAANTVTNANDNDMQQDRAQRTNENAQSGEEGPRPPRPPRRPHGPGMPPPPGMAFNNGDGPPPPPPPPPPPGMPGMPPGGFIRMLDLTDAQKEQIHQIHETERQKNQPLMDQLRANRDALDKATAQGQFDENTVRSIAASENQTRIELVVSRERTRAAIYQVLTPEQRVKLEQLEQEFRNNRPGPPPPPMRRQDRQN